MAIAAAVSGLTCAQAPASRLDPLDAKATVPPLAHRSSLATYRAYSEQAVGSWRDANETVNRIGGWKAYAREAREPAQLPEPAAARGTAPAGHGRQQTP